MTPVEPRQSLFNPIDAARDWLNDRRPDSGAMAILYQQRRSLYWLIIVVGVLAYLGLVSFLVLAVALVALAGAQAIVATTSATVTPAFAWFGLAAVSFGATVAATYLAARWASQYEVSD